MLQLMINMNTIQSPSLSSNAVGGLGRVMHPVPNLMIMCSQICNPTHYENYITTVHIYSKFQHLSVHLKIDDYSNLM